MTLHISEQRTVHSSQTDRLLGHIAASLLSSAGGGRYQVNLDRQQPAAHQFQFGIQRELRGGVLIERALLDTDEGR